MAVQVLAAEDFTPGKSVTGYVTRILTLAAEKHPVRGVYLSAADRKLLQVCALNAEGCSYQILTPVLDRRRPQDWLTPDS
jgi:hypothetical protein